MDDAFAFVVGGYGMGRVSRIVFRKRVGHPRQYSSHRIDQSRRVRADHDGRSGQNPRKSNDCDVQIDVSRALGV